MKRSLLDGREHPAVHNKLISPRPHAATCLGTQWQTRHATDDSCPLETDRPLEWTARPLCEECGLMVRSVLLGDFFVSAVDVDHQTWSRQSGFGVDQTVTVQSVSGGPPSSPAVPVSVRSLPCVSELFAEFCRSVSADVAVDVCLLYCCLLYTSPSPRDQLSSRMPSSA